MLSLKQFKHLTVEQTCGTHAIALFASALCAVELAVKRKPACAVTWILDVRMVHEVRVLDASSTSHWQCRHLVEACVQGLLLPCFTELHALTSYHIDAQASPLLLRIRVAFRAPALMMADTVVFFLNE